MSSQLHTKCHNTSNKRETFLIFLKLNSPVDRTNGIQLKVRLGEWDASSSSEPIPAQEFFVTRIFIHPQFNSANLKNDIAILRLSSAVPLGQTPTITTVCLPSNQISSQRCWIAGWGRNDFVTGSYQAIMKQVDVPLIDQATCQTQLRATRLGANFALDTTSFMCAGGESGKGLLQSFDYI